MSFWLAARSPRFALARAFGFRSISCGNGSTVRALASLCSALRAMGRRIVILSSVSTGICFVQSSWPYQPKQQNQEGSTAQDTPHGVKTPPAAQQLRCFLTAGSTAGMTTSVNGTTEPRRTAPEASQTSLYNHADQTPMTQPAIAKEACITVARR